MAELNFRSIFCDIIGNRLPPKDGSLENVCLIDRANLLLAWEGGIDRDLRDSLDFAFAVNHRIDRLDVAVVERDRLFRKPKIKTAGQFADADDVDSVGNPFGFEGRSIEELRIKETWPDICEEGKMFSQRKERGPFRLFVRRQTLPFRSADGTEKDRIVFAAKLQRFVGQRFAVSIDRDPTDIGRLVFQTEVMGFGHAFQHLKSDVHDLRSDAISGQYCKFESFH